MLFVTKILAKESSFSNISFIAIFAKVAENSALSRGSCATLQIYFVIHCEDRSVLICSVVYMTAMVDGRSK